MVAGRSSENSVDIIAFCTEQLIIYTSSSCKARLCSFGVISTFLATFQI